MSILLTVAALSPVACGLPALDMRTPGDPTVEVRASQATGLTWLRDVRTNRVSQRELSDRMAHEYRAVFTPADFERAERELVALGLAPPGFDLLEAILTFGRASMLGFYSSLRGELYVADEAVGLEADALAVHELVHALQDQHSKLPLVGLGLREDDDLSFAISSVLEGHALYAEALDAARVHGRPMPDPGDVMDVEGYRAAFPELPDVLVESSVRVYPAGYALVLAAHEAGGERAVRRLLADPPLSSEQALDPQRWLSAAERDRPTFLFPPGFDGGGCQEFARNTLGQLALQVWVGERARADPTQVGAGWDGDRFVLFDCDDGVRLLWVFEMDSARDAVELEEALRAGLDHRDRLAGSVAVDRRGSRVLASVGFSRAERDWLWARTTRREYRDLGAYLEAHPEVLERARSLRAAADREAGPRGQPGLFMIPRREGAESPSRAREQNGFATLGPEGEGCEDGVLSASAAEGFHE